MKQKKLCWMFWLVLSYVVIHYHEKLKKHYMYRFCECKYGFKLMFLWRKLKFYTRVYKKDVYFVVI